jgi:hypothetical protein
VIKKFVALGLGVSIVTGICLTGDEPLAAIPLTDYFPQRSYGAVVRKRQAIVVARPIVSRDPGCGLRRALARAGGAALERECARVARWG